MLLILQGLCALLGTAWKVEARFPGSGFPGGPKEKLIHPAEREEDLHGREKIKLPAADAYGYLDVVPELGSRWVMYHEMYMYLACLHGLPIKGSHHMITLQA